MNVLVIGASSGIGKETADIFSQNGHNVICSSRDEKELNCLVSDLKIRHGNNAYAIPVDLNDAPGIKKFIENVFKTLSRIDCVVVTAATMPANEMQYYDEKALMTTIMINYTGTVLILNAISQHMADNKSGTMICLSSVAGERGRQSNFIYGASKAALITYLQGLRGRMYNCNVQVSTVLPGYVDTLMSYGKVKSGLAVSPVYAANKIYSLIERKRDIIYIPAIWRLIMLIIKIIPEKIFKRLKL